MVLRTYTGSILGNFSKTVVVLSVFDIILLKIMKKRNFLYILIQVHLKESQE